MRQYKGSHHKCRQELQERKDCLSDSGELLEVESNYNGNFSHDPNQPAVVPSPRSMLSCGRRLSLDTWNPSGLQEHVFANPRSTFERGILHSSTPIATGAVPVHVCTQTPLARGEARIGSTVPMPTCLHEGRRLGSKDSRYRNFNLIN